MKNIYVSVWLILIVLTGCESTSLAYFTPGEVSIKVVPQTNTDWYMPSAESETEYNLSVFFTHPSGNQILYKFVDVRDIHKDFITLAVEPKLLRVKDVYIVANYTDLSELYEVTGIEGLEALMDAVHADSINLEHRQLCMLGALFDVDFEHDLNVPEVSLLHIADGAYKSYFFDQ